MNVTDVLVDELDKKVEQLKDWIASGQAEDYVGYQKTCGEIRGLLVARGYALDLKDRLEKADDE